MIKEWIRRKRNSLGFGIQSPNDFYFVQHVLREDSPYYAYTELHKMQQQLPTDLPHLSEESYRLLFRLANHIYPHTIIEVGTGAGLSACAMTMAHPMGECITIDGAIPARQLAVRDRLLADFPQITVRNGDEMALLQQVLSTKNHIGLLHIAHTIHYKEATRLALPHITDNTLFVIQGIRDNEEKRIWWEALQEERHTGVSYDLGETGLMFFDRSRHKDMYWVNLRSKQHTI